MRYKEGVLGEVDTAKELIHCAEKLRDLGYKQFEAYGPFPIHGMDHARFKTINWVGYPLLEDCLVVLEEQLFKYGLKL